MGIGWARYSLGRLTRRWSFGFVLLSACSTSASPGSGDGTSGAAGQSAAAASGTGGAAGSNATVSGGAGASLGGSSGSSVGGSGTGGSGTGGSGTGGSSTGGSSTGGSSAGAGGDATGASGSSGQAGSSQVPTNFFMRYEAESPSNTLTYPVEGVVTGATCPTDGVKEGAECASGGKLVDQILGRSPCDPPTSTTSSTDCQNKGGGIVFNEVTVPVSGTYDVTWWYHCGEETPGQADVFGDTTCGGLDYKTGAGSGCRPHMIDVNGAAMSSMVNGKTALYYQFPCYPGSWSTLHGATTALPLKAGMNTIYIHAPGASTLDAADVDALDVQPEGRGTAPPPLWPKLVTPVVSGS
jgi:hypothetical protein